MDAESQQVADLHAEIERLKRYQSEYKKREWDEAVLYNNLFKAKELITELCDALDRPEVRAFHQQWVENLIQRAREATQGG